METNILKNNLKHLQSTASKMCVVQARYPEYFCSIPAVLWRSFCLLAFYKRPTCFAFCSWVKSGLNRFLTATEMHYGPVGRKPRPYLVFVWPCYCFTKLWSLQWKTKMMLVHWVIFCHFCHCLFWCSFSCGTWKPRNPHSDIYLTASMITHTSCIPCNQLYPIQGSQN